jgi:proteasome lid subunit RPN8/RPN11
MEGDADAAGVRLKVIRLPERALMAIDEHDRATRPRIACGLLLGSRVGEEIVVTRTLACVNEAPLEVRTSKFLIEPRVVANVRRSIAGRGMSIVGSYYVAPGRNGHPASRRLASSAHWPGMVWVAAHRDLPIEAAPRAWWETAGDAGFRGLAVEILPTPVPSLLACSE